VPKPRDPTGDIVRGLIERKQLENGITRQIAVILSDMSSDLSALLARRDIADLAKKRELNKLLRETEARIDRARADVSKLAHREIAKVGVWESQRAARSIGVSMGANKVPQSLMLSIIETNPMNGLLLKDWFKDAFQGTQVGVRRQIQLGLSENETIDQIARRIRGPRSNYLSRGEAKKAFVRAKAITRTAVTQIANEAHHNVYSKYPDVTTEYEWVSVLDGRTSDICMARSGQTYPYGEGPKPPAHINCRSVIVPVVPGATDAIQASGGIENPDWKKGDPESERWLKKPGPTSASNYEEWLRDSSVKAQNEILGPAKAQMFRDGKLNLKQLVDRDGRSRTVATLSRKANIDVEEFAKGLGVKRVDYGGVNDIAEQVNKGLAEAHAKGYPLPENVRRGGMFDFDGDRISVPATYDLESNTLLINTKADYWADPAGVGRTAKESGFWSSASPSHAIRHELGHVRHAAAIGEDSFNNLLYSNFTPAQSRLVREQVSRYAAKFPPELVAEVHAGIEAGVTYSDEIMSLVDSLMRGVLP
jgi:SPP1 gp7 family putative phage head morphogenesis protein